MDEWPLTWGSDGAVYGAWGDGNGWEQGPAYNAIGVTRIDGDPPDVAGADLWRSNAFNLKPTSIVADADGIIHLFVNTERDGWDGTYYLVSRDDARSFTDPDSARAVFRRSVDGMEIDGWLQFGPGYTGVPAALNAGYFYGYLQRSAGGSPATGDPVPGTTFYLARVPKAEVAARAAYRFWTGTEAGTPAWTADITAAAPVLREPGDAQQFIGASYDAGLGMYLLSYGFDVTQLSVLLAPAPWGPWRAVFRGRWRDDEQKFAYMFSPKWMSPDGRTLWMTMSGSKPVYDNITFVRATLTGAP